MTAKDIVLIEEANRYSYTEWYKVCELEEQAESEEARKKLHNISTSLYHTEEYYAGML